MTSAQIILAIATGSGLAAASSAHCALMCGPLALATRLRHGPSASLLYFAGRLISYGVMGALAGGAGRVALLSPWSRGAEVALSCTLAVTLALTGAKMLRRRAKGGGLVQLGPRPRVHLAGRMLARVADDPLLLGAATALLPCGALFAGLLAAAKLGSTLDGFLAMSAFAAISSLALLAVGSLVHLDLGGRVARTTVAGALLVGAAAMLYRPMYLLHAEHAGPTCHDVAPAADRDQGAAHTPH